jgi:hypothetical protein
VADGKVSIIGKSPFYPHRDNEALTCRLQQWGEEILGAKPLRAAGFTVHQVWFLFSIMMLRRLSMESL